MNDLCLLNYQEAYGLESLDIIMKNYSSQKNSDKKISSSVEIDPNSVMLIEKRDIEINIKDEYVIKNKIKNLLNYKKKTIVYSDLYEQMLKYLIDNKLVIGNYFIINKELGTLLKLNMCMILSIDQLENIISYFIDKQ